MSATKNVNENVMKYLKKIWVSMWRKKMSRKNVGNEKCHEISDGKEKMTF